MPCALSIIFVFNQNSIPSTLSVCFWTKTGAFILSTPKLTSSQEYRKNGFVQNGAKRLRKNQINSALYLGTRRKKVISWTAYKFNINHLNIISFSILLVALIKIYKRGKETVLEWNFRVSESAISQLRWS